jgi:hypothetical protein
MAITVSASPASLIWSDFTVTPNQIPDPGDNTMVDAYTTFDYVFPGSAPVNTGGVVRIPDPYTIAIMPRASVWMSVIQTPGLLSHEQWHYDVATITGRALCRELARLRGSSLADLRTKMQQAVQLHFHTRAGLLQKRYDADTRHGTNAHYQKIWKDRMTSTLANPNADTMGGFWL